MSSSVGLLEFYILEAGEYVDRLDTLLAAATDGPPDCEALVTTSRALRGSSTMARMPRIAEMASCIERLGRATRDRSLSWNPAVHGAAVAAIDDLRVLLRAVRTWGSAEEQRAVVRIAELRRSLPADPRAPAAGAGATSPIYFASEVEAIAQSLETYLAAPTDRAALDQAVARARALRGVATLRELPPLPDVCDTLDRVSTVDAGAPPRELVQAAAQLLRAAARDLRSSGRTNPDSDEVRRFAAIVAAPAVPDDTPIVPVSTLFYADGGSGVVTRAARPRHSPEERFRRELVGHAEHLRRLVADARSATDVMGRDRAARELRAGLREVHNLAASFGATDVADVFGEALRAAEPLDPILLDALDSSAGLLADPSASVPDVARNLRGLLHGRSLDEAIGRGLAPIERSSTAPGKTPARSVTPPVSRPVTPPSTAAPRAPRRPAATPTGQELTRFLQTGIAGFDDLDSKPLSEPAPLDDAAVVPIDSLLYRGRAALERAIELREEMRSRGTSDASLAELFDLLDLAAAE